LAAVDIINFVERLTAIGLTWSRCQKYRVGQKNKPAYFCNNFAVSQFS